MVFRHLEVRHAKHPLGIAGIVLHGHGERGFRSEVVVALQQLDRDRAAAAPRIDPGLHRGLMLHVFRAAISNGIGRQVVGLAPFFRARQKVTGTGVNDFPVQAHLRVVEFWKDPLQREIEGATFGDAVTLQSRIRLDRDRRAGAGIPHRDGHFVLGPDSRDSVLALLPVYTRYGSTQNDLDLPVSALPRIHLGADLDRMRALSIFDIELPLIEPLAHALMRIVARRGGVQEVEVIVFFDIESQLYRLRAIACGTNVDKDRLAFGNAGCRECCSAAVKGHFLDFDSGPIVRGRGRARQQAQRGEQPRDAIPEIAQHVTKPTLRFWARRSRMTRALIPFSGGGGTSKNRRFAVPRLVKHPVAASMHRTALHQATATLVLASPNGPANTHVGYSDTP